MAKFKDLPLLAGDPTPPPTPVPFPLQAERFTLSPTNITTRSVTLVGMPTDNESVILIPRNGPTQVLGDDFILTGNVVSWNGLDYEPLAQAGDVILIYYL